MSLRHFAVPALAAVAVATAGCGSGSKGAGSAVKGIASTTATTTPTITTTTVNVATGRPLTRAALIAKGDAICARANAELAAISVTGRADFARVLPQVAIYDSTESSGLGKLVPPASLTSDWSKVINAANLFSEYVNHLATQAEAGGLNSPEVKTAEVARKQMAIAAGQLGFKHCSKIG